MTPSLRPAEPIDSVEPTHRPDPTDAAASADVPLHEAYRVCRRIVREHHENFPVASRFLAPGRRDGLAAIYAFARGADDVADADAPSVDRLRGLDRLERALLLAIDGAPRGAVLTALADAVERHRLPVEPFLDLLAAFRRDARNEIFYTWDDLLDYCRGSANTVGRLVLALHGIEEPDALRESDAVCTALQLTNFWQDLGRDLGRGRLFLPIEDLSRCGLEPDGLADPGRLAEPAHQEGLSRLLAQECRATDDLYERGRGIARRAPVGLAVQLRATVLGGRSILRDVERLGWRVLERRPTLGRRARARVLVQALLAIDA